MTRSSTAQGFQVQDTGILVEDQPNLRLVGLLDADGAAILGAELERRLALGQVTLHLDLEELAFISSAGVGSLISYVEEFREQGGDIVLRHASTELYNVFCLLSLHDYVQFED